MDENHLRSWIVRILPSEEAEETKGVGFWVAEGGYILTCTHLIEGMNPPWISYGEKKAPAEVLEQLEGIALLQVKEIMGEIAPLGTEWRRGDIIDSLGYQYEGLQGVSYFPMKGTILGQSGLDGIETIALEEAIHVMPGASGAPALNRRTGKVVGIISNRWEKQQIAFVLSLNKIVQKWEVLKPRLHSVDYRQEDIFNYYSPFVGREKEIQVVQGFLQNEQGQYLLIQGKAGIGKTALMAELARRGAKKELSPHVSCLVFFIRQEGKRNTPELFLDSLNYQLIQLLAEGEEVPISLAEKKRQYERLWKKVELRVSPQNRVLVLIDGLDESARAGKRPLIDYLPPTLPSYVYWVLTSRPLPDMLSAIPTTHFLRQAHSHWLAGLKVDEVRALLRESGDQVKRSDDFVGRLIKQTNGEPLFLRFLCQDIARWGEQSEASLEKIPGGVKEYFKRQFELLRERTKEAHDRNLAVDILKILLVAYSGMTAEELAGVLGVPLLDVRETLELIERFLLGKERKELMHLEFRRTVEEALVRDEEKNTVRDKLMAYCAKYWQKDHPKERYALRYYLQHLWELKRYQEMFVLCDAGYLEVKVGRLISPELIEEDYDSLFEASKELGNLTSMLRWGIHRATVSDEVTAFRDIKNIAEAIGELAQKGMENWWERGIGICALIPGIAGKVAGFLKLCRGLEPGKGKEPDKVFKRVRELLKEIPPGPRQGELIGRYVMELCRWGTTHIEQAFQTAAQIGDDRYRSEALASVAGGYGQLADLEKAAAGLTQVLEAATHIRNYRYRANVLVPLAQGYGQLPDVEKGAAGLTQVLEAATQIRDEYSRSEVLACVARGYGQLADVVKAAAGLSEVSETAAQFGNYRGRSEVLVSLAQGYRELPDVEKVATGLTQVLQAATQLGYGWDLLKVLPFLAEGYGQLPDVEKGASGLRRVLKAATQIGNNLDGSRALASVAQGYGRLPNGEKAAAGLRQVLQAAAQIEDESYRSVALASVAQGYGQLSDVEKAAAGLTQVLQAATQFASEYGRSKVLVSLAQGYGQLSDVEKAAAGLTQVLQAATQFVSEYTFNGSKALVSVAEGYGQLPDVEKGAAGLTQVLEAAAQLVSEYDRSKALLSVARGFVQLSDVEKAANALKQALEVGDQIGHEMLSFMLFASVAEGYGKLPDVEKGAAGLTQVLQAATQIGDEYGRSEVLVSVAQSYGQLADVKKGAAGLTQVLQAATQIGNEYGRSKVLVSVAQGYGQLPDVEKAAAGLTQVLQAAAQIGNEECRSMALSSVAEGYGQLPDVEKAAAGLTQVLQAAAQIVNECDRFEVVSFLSNVDPFKALVSVAQGYVHLPDIEKAAAGLTQVLKTATQPVNEYHRSEALSSLAQGYGQLRDLKKAAKVLKQALETAYQIGDEWYRSKALTSVAQVYGQLQDIEEAAKVLKQALQTASQIGDERYRPEALTSVAQGYVHLPDIEEAAGGLSQVLEAVTQIVNECDGFRMGPFPGEKGYPFETLASVAQSYVQLPDVEKAAAGLAQVLETAAQIGDEEYRLMALCSVAEGYVQLPDVEKAAAGLTQVLETAARPVKEYDRSKALFFVDWGLQDVNETASEYNRCKVFVSVAQGYGQLPDVDKAAKVLKQALETADQIGDEEYRLMALCSVAQGYGQLLDVEKAGAGLTQVLETAARPVKENDRPKALFFIDGQDVNKMKSDYNRCKVFASVAEGYGQLRDVEKAAKVLKQALETADQIGIEEYRVKGLCSVAQSYGHLPDVEKAAAGLSQVLEAADQIGDERYRFRALSSVAQGYGQLRDVEKAAKVLKQASETADQIGDERFRSKALSSMAQGHRQVTSDQTAYDLLSSISDDSDFVQTCKVLFTSVETVSEEKARAFLIDTLYRIIPLVSKRNRRVYLEVIREAVPFIAKYYPVDEARPVLSFVEEQWNV